MQTQLIEIPNSSHELIRGIYTPTESNHLAIMLHGFERNATAEKKFKRLADSLTENNVDSFRLDFTGCGISDGDFNFMTVESMVSDLERFIANFTEYEKISIVAHSLGACVASKFLEKNPNSFHKLILLSPALNQKDLMRYYFVKGEMKNQNPNLVINWSNFRDYLNEEKFIQDSKREVRDTKTNYFSNKYLTENLEVDYTKLLIPYSTQILHIHGNNDQAVPLESISFNFPNQLILETSDHDLEIPAIFDIWSKQAVEFICN